MTVRKLSLKKYRLIRYTVYEEGSIHTTFNSLNGEGLSNLGTEQVHTKRVT